MRALVTGGAGFIGSWVVERLLRDGHEVVVLDDFSNGSHVNLAGVASHPGLREVKEGSVADPDDVAAVWRHGIDVCFHLAAQGEVQKLIDNAEAALRHNIVGAYVPLTEARRHGTRFVFMSTCMVYASAADGTPSNEHSRTLPLSVYAASKLAGETATLAFHYTYGLPVVVLRPFNTYGPRQKSSQEGGVISIFIRTALDERPFRIFGTGNQTRDFLFVEDCADFVVRAGLATTVNAEVINAGTGRETSVVQLARMVGGTQAILNHVEHIHPQCEIHRMVCDSSKAKTLLGWQPRVSIEEGLSRTRQWIESSLGDQNQTGATANGVRA